jgi:hypothetical protein
MEACRRYKAHLDKRRAEAQGTEGSSRDSASEYMPVLLQACIR